MACSGVSCITLDRSRYIIPEDIKSKCMPIIWQLLGAERIDFVDIPDDRFNQDDLSHYEEMFPEARVSLRSYTPNRGAYTQ